MACAHIHSSNIGKKIRPDEKIIKVKEKMFLLQNTQNKNDFIICKLKLWGNYKMITLKQVKEHNYKFRPDSPFKNLLGERWEPIFRGGNLDIKYIDIKKYLDDFINKNNDFHKNKENNIQKKDKIQNNNLEGKISKTESEHVINRNFAEEELINYLSGKN